ncbi:MAG: hypothetical protein IJ300_12025 [Clostridia bacterium]|nr:hypothetical protein [Clostridia bacterium]MBQ8767376.1 hypothetical protein [Clostridia bacterium]
MSAAKKFAALALAVMMIFASGSDAAAWEKVSSAVVQNLPSPGIRLEGGRVIAEQKGFSVVLFDTESGRKTEIELAHKGNEAPGECVFSNERIFMKSENMTIEKIGGEWKLFGGTVYDFSGRPICELPPRENEKERPAPVGISAKNLPDEEEKIENLRVRWLGEKTVAITNGERLFYYCIESGTLTERNSANREVQSI